MKKIKVALNGSDILEKLRNMSKFQEIFEVTEAIMYESPFCNNAVTYEYGVSAEYIIIDLYAASYNLCIKEKDCVTWYSKEQGNRKAGCKILQFNDILKLDWQEKLYMYGENIKQYFPSEKIILVRSKKPEYYVTDCHCRVSANAYREFNCFLETIENFLIEVFNCHVIKLCDKYYSVYSGQEKRNGFEYEPEFYENILECIEKIVDGREKQREHTELNYVLTLKRYQKYYNHMEYTNLQKLLLNDSDLIDHIVLNLGKKMISKYIYDLEQIKLKAYQSYESIYEFYDFEGCTELLKSIRCIELIDKKEFACPDFDYSIIFSNKMRLMKTMIPLVKAKCIAEKILGDIEITEKNIEVCFHYLNLFLRREYRKCTELILKNTNLLVKPYSVDVWGSCISREIYNVNSGIIKINKYLYRCCCLHAFEKKVDIEETLLNSNELFGSAWKRAIVVNEVYRKAEEIINSSTSKWIIMDFFDITERCFEYKGQTFILDLFAYKGPFYNKIKDECKDFSYLEQSEELIKARINKLVCFLKKKYGSRIILNRHIRSNKYVTLEGEIKYFSNLKYDELAHINLFIRKWEEYFISQTNCYSIDIAKNFLGDEYAIWGVSQVHYERCFFEESIRIVEEIIQNEPVKKVYDKYSYRTRIERILRFIDKNRGSAILERMFDDNYLDKILLQMDSESIEKNKEIFEEIYECEYSSYMEFLEKYNFEKSNSVELKNYIMKKCDLILL